MFDRFTKECKKTMALARQAAQRLKHASIGPEHILAGLLECGSISMNELLADRGIEDALEARVRPGDDDGTAALLPFTPDAKKVVELSLNEASDNGHRFIATSHVLAALLGLETGVAPEILSACGIGLDAVREHLRTITPHDFTD